ncbi:hypothetical protein JCM10213v2_006008 [Rhodosporidiobolus nylandii]
MAQPSPARPGRLGEDKAGNGGNARRSPLSLLDLPDELLDKIFRLLYASLLPEDLSDVPNGLAVPVSHTLITKRIHRVALPIWLSAMCGGTESSLAAPRRRTLSISFADDDDYLPPSFLRMLRCLVNLHRLDIANYPDVEHLDLDIARDVPSLRILSVSGLDISSQVFKGRLDSLSQLILRTSRPGTFQRVWPSVPHLTFAPESGDFNEADNFLSLLKSAATSHLSPFLHTTRVSFSARTTKPVSNDIQRFTCTHLYAILELLRSSPVEHLDLFFVDSLDWAAHGAAFPSLRVLTLTGSCKLYKEATLAHLPSLFTLFPSLESLHLCGFAFSATAGEPASFSPTAPHAVPFILRFPTLVATVVFLASTGLLEFRCRITDGKRELRWTRRSREDEFECEGWTLE